MYIYRCDACCGLKLLNNQGVCLMTSCIMMSDEEALPQCCPYKPNYTPDWREVA